MDLSRYFAGGKTEAAREAAENPFRWAAGIESSASTGGDEPVESVFEASGFDDATGAQDEVLDSSALDERSKPDRAWLSRFGSSEPSERRLVGKKRLEEVVVKRNDLWESDWEVRVSDSGTEGIESEKPHSGRSQGFGHWIRSVLGLGAQSEGRKAVDL